MKLIKTALAAAVAASAFAAASPAIAFETSAVTARFRAVHLSPADKSDAIAALAAPKDTLDVEAKWIPDVDFEYALSPNWGLELLLTVPQKHDVVARQTALGNDVALGGAKLTTVGVDPWIIGVGVGYRLGK